MNFSPAFFVLLYKKFIKTIQRKRIREELPLFKDSNMKKFCFLFIILLCLKVSAQENHIVWGYLKDSATHEPIALASVTNINTKQTVLTSNTGLFSINLTEKQVLSFAAIGFHFDTIHYSNQYLLQDTLQLKLSPLVYNLGNVTVSARGMSQYQLDSTARRKDFLQDIVSYTIPTIAQANSGAGIALNIDRFSRHEKTKRRAFAFFDAREKEAYVDYRFPASLVTKYSGLKEEKLQQFMQLYRPSNEWLRAHKTEEDISYYINDKLKLFFKRG